MDELKETLAAHRDFSHLEAGDRDVLLRAFTVETWPASEDGGGHEFTREGEEPHAAWLILEGEVVVSRETEKEAFLDELTRLRAGDLFGLAALVTEGRRTATCRAVGPIRVARMERSAFDWLLRDHAPLGLALQRAVARQLAADYRAIATRIRTLLEQRL